MILSLMKKKELEAQSVRLDYPKWSSICSLRLLNIPTLDASFVSPSSQPRDIEAAAHKFSLLLDQKEIMVRSDGGAENKSYYRGGKTFALRDAVKEAVLLSQRGRAVIFVEPTNRFMNLFCFNLMILNDGSWIGEALGPGYDTSDLQRGYVSPKWRVSGPNFIHARLRRVAPNDLSISEIGIQSDLDRLNARLLSIAHLMDMDTSDNTNAKLEASNFLRRSSNTLLLEADQSLNMKTILNTIKFSRRVYDHFRGDQARFPLTIAAAKLWDERFVIWDITYGKLKWSTN